MKKIMLILLITTSPVFSQETDSISLFDCFEWAVNNYPLYSQKNLNDQVSQYRISNISKSWLPSVNANGQATYQSDVIETSFFTAPHDQYKLYLNINQNIYDGGISRQQKEMEYTNLDLSQQQLEVNFHNLKQQVSSVYFSLVMITKSHEQLNLMLNDLKEKHKAIEVAVNNGAALPSSEQSLRAEILTLQQQSDELVNKKNSLIDVLKQLTGKDINNETLLSVPEMTEMNDSLQPRPEMRLFDYQQQLIDNNIGLSQSLKRPKFYAYSEAGYGKPGLNFLNDKFETYYIVGLGLKWNLFDWGELKNNKRSAEAQKNIIELKKDDFNRNIDIALQNELAYIKNFQDAIDKDKEITALRSEIAAGAFSRFKNGTATATDYITEVNAELKAKLQMEIHKISLVQSLINYQLIKGDI